MPPQVHHVGTYRQAPCDLQYYPAGFRSGKVALGAEGRQELADEGE